jgi:hypothetical protein
MEVHMKNQNQTEEVKSKTPPTHVPEELNYNDRPDGYGVGESESRHEGEEYESDPELCRHCKDMGEGYRTHKNEPYSTNELGLRNPYGPVDQYTFREPPLRKPKKNQ